MYGDAPFANGVAAIASGPIDAASVNGILGGGLGGVHPTPIEGLSCPQCRLMPVVDAAPNIILKSLIEVLIKVSQCDACLYIAVKVDLISIYSIIQIWQERQRKLLR